MAIQVQHLWNIITEGSLCLQSRVDCWVQHGPASVATQSGTSTPSARGHFHDPGFEGFFQPALLPPPLQVFYLARGRLHDLGFRGLLLLAAAVAAVSAVAAVVAAFWGFRGLRLL